MQMRGASAEALAALRDQLDGALGPDAGSTAEKVGRSPTSFRTSPYLFMLFGGAPAFTPDTHVFTTEGHPVRLSATFATAANASGTAAHRHAHPE